MYKMVVMTARFVGQVRRPGSSARFVGQVRRPG